MVNRSKHPAWLSNITYVYMAHVIESYIIWYHDIQVTCTLYSNYDMQVTLYDIMTYKLHYMILWHTCTFFVHSHEWIGNYSQQLCLHQIWFAIFALNHLNQFSSIHICMWILESDFTWIWFCDAVQTWQLDIIRFGQSRDECRVTFWQLKWQQM